MTAPTIPDCFEERLLAQLKAIIAATSVHLQDPGYERPSGRVVLPGGPEHRVSGDRWQRLRRSWLSPPSARGWACAFVVALAAVVGLVVVPSLGGSQAGTAQAAVLTRARAALEQPNTILYVQEQTYGGGDVLCFAGWAWSTMTKPLCVGGSSTAAAQGISADPTQDTLNYSFQEWIGPGQSESHTLYNNGDETVYNGPAHEYQVYDPTDNTLTTLKGTAATAPGPGSPPSTQTASPPLSPLLVGPFGVAAEAASGALSFEQLYQDAQSGAQSTVGELSVTSQLVGQTTIDGESVYELSFDMHITPPASPPAGDMCGSTVCSPPDTQTLVYLDSQTFMPVRSVVITVNGADRPGFAAGTTVRTVTDYTIQTLPDTPANEALLEMGAHPGATTISEAAQQYDARLKALGRSVLSHRRAETKLARDRARGRAAVRNARQPHGGHTGLYRMNRARSVFRAREPRRA